MLRRNYITDPQIPAGATQDQVAFAEELIDAYVGAQEKHVKTISYGTVTAHDSVAKKVFDTSARSQLQQITNWYARCVIELIDGTGAGQIRNTTASDMQEHSVTYEGDVFSPIDTTTIFRIYQFAKVPRLKDIYGGLYGLRYAKPIPQAIQDATIAQVEFIQEKAPEYFEGGATDFESESFLNYSYQRGAASGSQSALVKMIAPRARALLRGIKNSGGKIIVGPESDPDATI